jgi:hypothetical protein
MCLKMRADSKRVAAAILLMFLCVGVAYSLAVPPFEAPDEIYHFAFVRRLAQGADLPVQTRDSEGPWSHEGTQAPLYYFLAGRLTAGIDQGDFDRMATRNPYGNMGNPLYPGNKNVLLYSAEHAPLAGTNLALHVARWLSLALAGLTLWLIYLIARLAWPGQPGWPLVVMLTVAWIPQFAFVGVTASNDSLVTALCTLVLFGLARLLARPVTRPIAAWEWLSLGIVIGLAALSKLPALGLLPLTGLAILWLARRRRSWRLIPIALGWVVLPALAVAGWWYWRNHVLYGEWLGVNRLLSINGQRAEPRTWRGFVGEMRGLRYSFWGLFGWFSILLPEWVYRILDIVSLAALAGLGVAVIRARRSARRSAQSVPLWRLPTAPIWGLLAIWAAAIVGLMLYWSTFGASSQGRLLFPAIASFSILLVAGLAAWTAFLPRRWQLPAILPLPLGLAACSLYVLTVLLPGSYAPLRPVVAVPPEARPIHDTYSGGLEVVGITLAKPQGRFRLGDEVPVTLYLRADQEPSGDVPLFVQLLDDRGEVLGNVTSEPGWGRFPTSLWEPGALYEDRYRVRIERNPNSRSPLLARVYVGFMDAQAKNPLPAITADGQEATGMTGTVEVAAEPLDGPALGLRPAQATFGSTLRLAGYSYPPTAAPGATVRVALLWEAAETLPADYTTFVHLTGPEGRQFGRDLPPAEGRFPTTLWRAGDRSLTYVDLPLPADAPKGPYRIWAGVYPSASQGAERLPLTTSDLRVQDDAVFLGTLELK